jgi:nitrogen fixation protein NifU and related proteins
MFRDELLRHFQNVENAGPPPEGAHSVTADNPACGDTMRLWVVWSAEGVVERAGFQVRGCTASIAAGSALTSMMRGMRRKDFEVLGRKGVEAALDQALGGLPPEMKHAAALSAAALLRLMAS